MTIAETFINEGMQGLMDLQDNPQFTWKGVNYYCIPSALNVGQMPNAVIEDSSWQMSVPFKVKNANGDFVNQFTPNVYPNLNEHITYLGTELKIVQIKKPAHGQCWVYVCQVPKFTK